MTEPDFDFSKDIVGKNGERYRVMWRPKGGNPFEPEPVLVEIKE